MWSSHELTWFNQQQWKLSQEYIYISVFLRHNIVNIDLAWSGSNSRTGKCQGMLGDVGSLRHFGTPSSAVTWLWDRYPSVRQVYPQTIQHGNVSSISWTTSRPRLEFSLVRVEVPEARRDPNSWKKTSAGSAGLQPGDAQLNKLVYKYIKYGLW